jgi:multiple sugar transport system permease protein
VGGLGMIKQKDTIKYLQRFLLVAVVFAFIFPFIWMVLASLKTQQQILNNSSLLYFTPTFKNYTDVFEQYSFLKFIFNSLAIAIGSTVFALILGLPAAYSIARYRQEKLGLIILVARIVPGITFLIPWFILFSKLHLVDSYTSMILSHMLVGLPFIVWIMVSYFENLPLELEESARVDGCTIQEAFLRIVLPISGPGIITASIFSFVFSWNNFMFSLVLSGDKTKTLPIAVFSFLSYSEINWGGLMAAAVVITLPVLILALFAQKYIISGLTSGAVKG